MWYLQPTTTPAPQLLYDMGMETDLNKVHVTSNLSTVHAPYLEITHLPLHVTPPKAKNLPLPLQIISTPEQVSLWQPWLNWRQNRMTGATLSLQWA